MRVIARARCCEHALEHLRANKAAEGCQFQHDDIHKSSANENAVIERSFRTDEDEFFLLVV